MKKQVRNCDNVSRETLSQLTEYSELIKKWNISINLVSPQSVDDLWERHIVDSLQLSSLLPKQSSVVTDLGSGGGLPGIVVAISCPQHMVNLIESDQRKCAFLTQVVAELGLKNVKIHCSRIEEVTPWESDVVMARALASLKQLIRYAKPFMNKEGVLIFPKGKTIEQEIIEIKKSNLLDYKLHKSATDKEAVIIEINKID